MPSRVRFELKGEAPPAGWRALGADPPPETARKRGSKPAGKRASKPARTGASKQVRQRRAARKASGGRGGPR
jgi:hypothetical protein